VSRPEDEVASRLLIVTRLKELLASIIDYSAAYWLYERSTGRLKHRSGLRTFQDPKQAVWAGARAALGVALASTIWIIADWPSGAIATILSSVVAARLATMERAATVAIAAAIIFSLVPIPGFILIEVLLPAASSFEMFALILGPAIFMCALLMGDETSPLKFLVGFLCGLFIPSVGGFQDQISYDAIGFINTSIAVIFAVSVGAILFTVLAPETPHAVRKRFVRAARSTFTELADPRRFARVCELQMAMGDALAQFAATLHPNEASDVAALDAGTALLEVASILTRLGSEAALARGVAAFLDRPNRERLVHSYELALAGAELGYAELRDGAFIAPGVSAAIERIAAYSVIADDLKLGATLVLEEG
jgi:uncharacterized membrane protein YccC